MKEIIERYGADPGMGYDGSLLNLSHASKAGMSMLELFLEEFKKAITRNMLQK